MLVLIPIFLLILVPLLMLVLHLTQWKRASQWLLAVVCMLIAWPLVLAFYFYLPQTISITTWAPETFFPTSPVLLLDEISWAFSFALVALGLALVLTSVARIEQGEQPAEQLSSANEAVSAHTTSLTWTTWAGSLLIISMGLVAVQSGNLITILLSWAAIDIIELLVLFTQIKDSPGRERAIIAFSTRLAGIGVLILAQIQIWQTGRITNISSISPQSAVYLLIAAGLRLGVFPLHLYFLQEIPLRRSMGTILRLVPTAASLSLLVRAASVGIEDPAATYLLVFCAAAAVFGAMFWVLAPDELSGRPYWILGTASLATASAISGSPDACLAWGITSILVGGLLSFTSLRHPRLRIVGLFALLGLSGLPFTPNFAATLFYNTMGQDSPVWLSALFYLSFIIAHAFLITGFLRHMLRSTILAGDIPRNPQVERWIWLVYPLGLAILPITHFLIGFWALPNYEPMPLSDYVIGIATSVIGFGLWYTSKYLMASRIGKPINLISKVHPEQISFAWLYSPIWYLYYQLRRLSRLIYSLLEGDGGILWAIVLFFFILMFIQR